MKEIPYRVIRDESVTTAEDTKARWAELVRERELLTTLTEDGDISMSDAMRGIEARHDHRTIGRAITELLDSTN